jgi:hypothetical protein
MRDVGDSLYMIRLKPTSEGLHAVSVFYKEQHVNGEKSTA